VGTIVLLLRRGGEVVNGVCYNKAGLSIAILGIKVRAVMCIHSAGLVTISHFVRCYYLSAFSPRLVSSTMIRVDLLAGVATGGYQFR